MAKPVTIFRFTLAPLEFDFDPPIWHRIPDFNFSGFTGDMTISRVRCNYQIGHQPTANSNGERDSALMVALAVTTGNPPVEPVTNAVQDTANDEIIYKELAWEAFGGSVSSIYTNPLGFIDTKAQRSYAAAPESAAVWFQVARFDRLNLSVGSATEIFAQGIVVRLGNPSA